MDVLATFSSGVILSISRYKSLLWIVSILLLSLSLTFTPSVQAQFTTTLAVGSATVDHDLIDGRRWTRVKFDPIISGTHTIRVVWDSDAEIMFSIFQVRDPLSFANDLRIGTTNGTTTPDEWTGTLDISKQYYLGVWVSSGSADFSVTVAAETDEDSIGKCKAEQLSEPSNRPLSTMVLSEVIDYGIAGESVVGEDVVSGQVHNVISFSPKQNGPFTIELEWQGKELMNLALFSTNSGRRLSIEDGVSACVVSSPSSITSFKRITLNLRAGKQYHATAWIEDGSAEWVMRKIQKVRNPDRNISDLPDFAEKPNIVLINTDDQRASTLEFLPAIQEHLVEKGVTYTNTIVPTPSCCPSRATTLSGQYVHNNGQFQQLRQNEAIFEKTFQKYLQEDGYFTGHAGKYLHWLDTEDPVPPYWDRWTYISGGFYGVGSNFDGLPIKSGGYTTDIIFERTKDYLRDFEMRDDDNPWFVYIAPLSPHSPATAEYDLRNADVPELNSRSLAYLEADISDKPDFFKFRFMDDAGARDLHEQRARNLLSLDREIEQFIQYLEDSGELDNTLIIFTSDNGYIMGEHQTFGKFTPYRDSVQVPLVIRWPGHVAENKVNDTFVSHVDIAPTILEAAGVDTGAITLDGHSIFSESRDTFYMEYFLDAQSNGGRIGDWASLRTDKYQYTEWYDSDGSGDVVFREYYDMVNDPYQLENLYENGDQSDDPDYTKLSAQLLDARQCSGDACP